MRLSLGIFVSGLAATLVGCSAPAAEPSTQRVVSRHPPARPAVSTSALAFTPPVARGVDLDLDRTDRGPYAYVGYESQVFSQTWVYQDDNQRFEQHGRGGSGDYSRFERRAVTSSVTVRQR